MRSSNRLTVVRSELSGKLVQLCHQPANARNGPVFGPGQRIGGIGSQNHQEAFRRGTKLSAAEFIQ